MPASNRTVLIAKNIQDVFYHIKSVSDIQVLGAATGVNQIKDKCVTLRDIPELKTIERHERFVDFGSSVTLNEILNLKKAQLPPVLCEAIETIGTQSLRNIQTLGGNICSQGIKHTLWAPMLALNARIEIRNQNDTKYQFFDKFTEVLPGYILSKVRIPLDDWEVSIFRRVGPESMISPLSASFVFLADPQKDMIANIRIVFAGSIVFHSADLENRLLGTRLPLNLKFIDSIVQEAEIIYDKEFSEADVKPVLKVQFLNLLRYSLEQLM